MRQAITPVSSGSHHSCPRQEVTGPQASTSQGILAMHESQWLAPQLLLSKMAQSPQMPGLKGPEQPLWASDQHLPEVPPDTNRVEVPHGHSSMNKE